MEVKREKIGKKCMTGKVKWILLSIIRCLYSILTGRKGGNNEKN